MTRPIIKIHNTETNEVIEREMTDPEFAQYEIDQENYELSQAKAQIKAEAKKSILDRLGLSAEELQTILG
jgi:hypothetical protein